MLIFSTIACAEVTIKFLQANLIAKGAGVTVSIQATCDPILGDGSSFQAGVGIIQRIGNNTTQASGGGISPINCDGLPHTVNPMIATVSSFGNALKKGSAILFIGGAVFSPSFTQEQFSFTQEVQIQK